MAIRQGLKLRKSPRRDPRALDFGLYALLDESAGYGVPIHPMNEVMNTPYSLTLDEARWHLEDDLDAELRTNKPIQMVEREFVDAAEEERNMKRRIAAAHRVELVGLKAEVAEYRKAGMRAWVNLMESAIAAREAELAS